MWIARSNATQVLSNHKPRNQKKQGAHQKLRRKLRRGHLRSPTAPAMDTGAGRQRGRSRSGRRKRGKSKKESSSSVSSDVTKAAADAASAGVKPTPQTATGIEFFNLYNYINMYISTYIYICIHIFTYIYTYIHIYIHVYIYTYIYIYIDICAYIYIHIYTHIYIHMCTCTYIHINTHIYTYLKHLRVLFLKSSGHFWRGPRHPGRGQGMLERSLKASPRWIPWARQLRWLTEPLACFLRCICRCRGFRLGHMLAAMRRLAIAATTVSCSRLCF